MNSEYLRLREQKSLFGSSPVQLMIYNLATTKICIWHSLCSTSERTRKQNQTNYHTKKVDRNLPIRMKALVAIVF